MSTEAPAKVIMHRFFLTFVLPAPREAFSRAHGEVPAWSESVASVNTSTASRVVMPQGLKKKRRHLRITGAQVSYVDGTRSLSVPITCLESSSLITECRQTNQIVVHLPSLSIDDFSVWLSCSRSLKAGNGFQRCSDDDMVCAWKVAKVLKDDEMQKALLHAIADMVDQVVKDALLDPTQADKFRRQFKKVLKPIPDDKALCLCALLKSRPAFETASGPQHANILLRFLPGKLHRAIVEAFCISTPEGGAAQSMCSIVTHACEAPGLCLNDIDYSSRCLHNAADTHKLSTTATTTAFQLLAAATPLADGSLERAGASPIPNTTSEAFPKAAKLGQAYNGDKSATDGHPAPDSPQPGHAALGEGDGDCSQSSSSKECKTRATLTRLLLRFDVLGVMQMPSMWCVALRQLVTLQHVHLEVCASHVGSGFRFCMEEFASALVSLTALEKLAIRFDVSQDRRQFKPDVVRVTSESTFPLLSGLARLPELAHLVLDGCINFHISTLVRSEDPSDHINKAFLCLSKLKQLKSLVMRFSVLFGGVGAQYGSEWAAALGGAVRQLPALRKLHLVMDVCSVVADNYSTPVAAADELVLELFSKPGLMALKDLGISLDRGRWMLGNGYDPAGLPATLFKRVADCIRHKRGASLVQLTSLTLRKFNFAEGSRAAAMVASMIARWTALQSLTLSSMAIKDVGLRAVSWVLPRLQGLTYLDISDTGATAEGVLAVLGALLGPRRAGQHSLESLNISRSCIMVHTAQRWELADLLRQCHRLEKLDIEGLLLGFEGVRAVTLALGGLAHLRSVKACGNISRRPVMACHDSSVWLKEDMAMYRPGVSFTCS